MTQYSRYDTRFRMFSFQDHGKMEDSHHLQGGRQLHLGEVSMSWDKVGNDRCLQSDTDIASFLLRYYEDTCAGHQSAAYCTHCHTPLELMCPKCISDEKAQHQEKFLQQVKFLQRNEPRMAENQAPAVSASNVHEEIDIPQLPSVDINLPDMMEATSDLHVMTSTVESAIPALMTPQHEPNFQREVNNTEVTYTELTPGDSSGTEDESQASSGNACPHCKCEFAHPVCIRHLSLQICYTKEGPSVPPIQEPPQMSGSDTFKCTLCTSVFFNPDLLTKHMSMHADHMPYNCSECGAGFLKSSVLDLHMQKHKGRYTCTRCKAEFANAIGLTCHMKSSDCKAVAEPAQDKGSENVYAPENMVMASYMPQAQKEDASLKTNIWDDEPQGKFECDKCGKRWTNQYNLERHMLTHTGQRSYACHECGAAFLQQCHLESHVRRKHVPAKPIKCGSCGMTFITSASLEKHDCQPPPAVTQVKKAPLQQLHFHPDRRGRPPKTRPIEPVVTLSSVGLVSGGQNSPAATRATSGKTTQAPASSTFSEEPDKDTRPHTCTFCRAEFTYATDLTAHLQKHTGQKEFKCSHCDAAFMKAHSLMRHVFKHTEPQQVCSYCGMTFSTSTQLTDHIRTHTGETPFKCDICGAAFREKRNWKIHLRIHTGEKPYLCEDCGWSFAQVSNYRRHTRIHTGERPYACQQCPRTFADKSLFNRHLRKHAGLKSHECSQCGKFFRDPYSLKVHMRSHTKEKPFKCPLCDSAFSMNYSLTKHMRVHTGEKPYECPICGHKFVNPSNRAAHVKIHKRLNPI